MIKGVFIGIIHQSCELVCSVYIFFNNKNYLKYSLYKFAEMFYVYLMTQTQNDGKYHKMFTIMHAHKLYIAVIVD